jgi:N6-L-threonylcarbamoyladenine synthase
LKSARLEAEEPPENFVALVLSGGHSALYRVARARISILAETRDDAMGEVFDKVGKSLGLPYPQGPRVDEIAEDWGREGIRFSVARCSDGSLDFSFSGLKTETLRALERATAGQEEKAVDELIRFADVREVLAGFRRAAVDQVLDRLDRLFRQEHFASLAVSGGAAANRLLRRRLPEWAADRGVDIRLVKLVFSGDNAAMIAHAAGKRLLAGDRGDSPSIEAASRLPLG